jgi:serine/threonine-protein kinase
MVGTRLGQYRIVQVLGRGSMGRVYQAEHAGLHRISALKVLSPGLVARQPRMLVHFQAEARAVAALAHPNVVTVHNLGSDRGYHYIEMELVPGGVSLTEELVREGAFEPARAVQLVRQVSLALDAAHGAGLVHRDIKPSNVLLMPDGRAKLADFGLVRRIDGRDRASSELAGTPTFMAPELFRGEPASARTDLYAVGVMLYYLLTARLPFASDRISKLVRLHKHAPVPDPRKVSPDVPEELATIVMQLLEKDPQLRPDSAASLAAGLKAVLEHVRDSESLVTEAALSLKALVQPGRDSFRVVIPVLGDRIQEVYVETKRVRGRERFLTVYSVCGPADPRHYEFALRLNAELALGGLSIREVNGSPMFVISRTLSQSRTTPTDLAIVMKEIARRGDQVEQRISDGDLF